MVLSYPQVNIVIFSVEISSCKAHAFRLNTAEFRITIVGTTILSLVILQYLGNTTTGIANSVLSQLLIIISFRLQ